MSVRHAAHAHARRRTTMWSCNVEQGQPQYWFPMKRYGWGWGCRSGGMEMG